MSNTLVNFGADDYVNTIATGNVYAAKSIINDQYVLSFLDGYDEIAYFRGVFPRQATTGNVNVNLHWSQPTTGTGAVAWMVEFERHIENTTDLNADNFAAGKTVLDTANAAYIENVAAFTVTPAELDNIVAGENFRLRITRVASNTGDVLPATAHFRSIELWQ